MNEESDTKYRDLIIDASIVGNSPLALCLRLEADAAKNSKRHPGSLTVVNFRTRAAEAIQKKDEVIAAQWALAAYSTEHAIEAQQKIKELSFLERTSEKTVLIFCWHQASQAAERAAQHRALLGSGELKNEQQKDYQDQAAFYSENSFDYSMRALEAVDLKNQFLLDAWKQAAAEADVASDLWAKAARSVGRWNSFRLITIYWIEAARRAENKTKRTLLRIASYVAPALPLQQIKDPIVETTMQKISFCLPEECIPDDDCKRRWKEGKSVPRVEFTMFYSWIYQSWNLLQQNRVTCALSTQLLEPGIVITLGAYLITSRGIDGRLPEDVFLIDVVADRAPHPGAQLHLVENAAQAKLLPNSLFMPHWPQARLIPRNRERGTRFENIVFFGEIQNLAPELQSEEWRERLKSELGISFYLQGNTGWHDYSQTDCVLAIRDFKNLPHFNKPATKLYNAWLAGVPFIGGGDSAYAADGRPGIDYLVASSAEEVVHYLKRLKEDPLFRTKLVNNGIVSGKNFTQEATLERWQKLIEKTVPRLVTQWQKKSAFRRHLFFIKQTASCFLNRYW